MTDLSQLQLMGNIPAIILNLKNENSELRNQIRGIENNQADKDLFILFLAGTLISVIIYSGIQYQKKLLVRKRELYE